GLLCLEGVREERKFLRVHSGGGLLGSRRFEEVVTGLVAELPDGLNVSDVYREPRFDSVDFPSVVRSLVCLPIVSAGATVGALALSHSQPHFFDDSHLRMLKILAGMIAHTRLLADGASAALLAPAAREPVGTHESDHFALVLLEVERLDSFGRPV